MKLISYLLIFILLSGCERVMDGRAWWANRQAASELKQQKWGQARSSLIEGLSYEPFLSPLHLNLGYAFESEEQKENALAAYQEALRLAGSPEEKFVASFNLAQLYGKAKNYDLALENYQRALEIRPDSLEVKTNIELLIQQQQQDQQSGEGESQQQQQDQNQQQQQKNQGQGQGQDQQKPQDQPQDSQGDQKDEKDKEQDKKDKPKDQYSQSPKYKPRPFKGQELSEGDVKKILGELKQQEQKIRADFNRKESKEEPRAKDW